MLPEVALEIHLPGWPGPFQGLTSRASLVQGFDSAFAASSAPRWRLLAPWVGYPEPRDPGTFCRGRVAKTARAAVSPEARLALSFTHPPDWPACAKPVRRRSRLRKTLRQGRFPCLPAKESTVYLPKVPSIVGCFPPGWGRARSPEQATMDPGEGGRLSTGCSQPVENSPAPLQPLPFGYVLTDVPWQGLASWFPPKPEGWSWTWDRSAPDDFCVQDDPRLG